jgi:nicotinamide-nucleotide amidase
VPQTNPISIFLYIDKILKFLNLIYYMVKKLEIIIIGNEILIGKTQDTNSSWLARHITKFGHLITRITTIPDDVDVIAASIKESLERVPDIIITSGGLGPTWEDLTLNGVAIGINRELKLDKMAYNMLERRYNNIYRRGITKVGGMTKTREKMAYLPEDSYPLSNPIGAAPGVEIEEGKTKIICLPGVPAELKGIFKLHIIPIIKMEAGNFTEKTLNFQGIGESEVAPMISSVQKQFPEVYLKTHPKLTEQLDIELSITAFNVENAEEIINHVLEIVEKKIIKLNGRIIRK